MPFMNFLLLAEIIVLLVCYFGVFILNASAKKGDTERKLGKINSMMKIVGITMIVNFFLSVWVYDNYSYDYYSYYFYVTEELMIIAAAMVLLGVGFLLKNGFGKALRIIGLILNLILVSALSVDYLSGGYVMGIFFAFFWLMAILSEFVKGRAMSWVAFVPFVLFLLGCIAIAEEGIGPTWACAVFSLPAMIAVEHGQMKKNVNAGDGELCFGAMYRAPALERSLPMHIFLCVITCGIYELIWVYHVSKYLNDRMPWDARNPVGSAWLCLLPFYRVYWTYRQALRMESLLQEKGEWTEALAIVSFIAALLCPLLSSVLLQNKIATLLKNEA